MAHPDALEKKHVLERQEVELKAKKKESLQAEQETLALKTDIEAATAKRETEALEEVRHEPTVPGRTICCM